MCTDMGLQRLSKRIAVCSFHRRLSVHTLRAAEVHTLPTQVKLLPRCNKPDSLAGTAMDIA